MENKSEKYRQLLKEATSLVSGESDLIANMANLAALVHETMGFWWTGFYIVRQDKDGVEQLVLGPFQGPVACTRIAFGRGVCGTAWQRMETIIVPDVEQFPGHIACSSESRSEIVVPILKDGKVIAVLDIDSRHLNRFDNTDAHHLEALVALLDIETISHLILDEGFWRFQSNKEHLEGVSLLASYFASDIGYSDFGRVLGLLHDKGKEQKSFQQNIRKKSGYKPHIKVEGDSSHAYVGALIAKQIYPNFAPLLAYPIMGHHAGLYDYMDYNEVLKKTIPSDVAETLLDIKLLIPKNVEMKKYDYNHVIRVLFSCLVDADFLDTEAFMNPEQAKYRGEKKSLKDLYPMLEAYLTNLKSKSKSAETVNIIRQKVQQACADASSYEPGFYSLTVPTGGGKTLSSLLWAMKHALKYDKKRIIIAIPYTSIIVQTAAILRDIFGDESVLEHHSNISFDDVKDWNIQQRIKLATENWDYPIIVTTNVQLFESIYSNCPSDCRKLHNICNSVLILDEVQALPIEYLQPIVNSLKSYQRLFKTSILFTTASQPVLKGTYTSLNDPNTKLEGIDSVTEIIPKDFNLHDSLRRVEIHMEKGTTTLEELANELVKHPRVLCIVNTRKTAQDIYSKLPDEGLTIHLSRMMCPKHVGDAIKMVKNELKSDKHPIIRVIATQLIEAGVDIDFPVVYREEAGLDSILQAAGRCNREGKLDMADTFVFSLDKVLPQGYITQTNNARKNMLSRSFDWFSPEAMTEYFNQLYAQVKTFDKVDIRSLLENPRSPQFKTAAEAFRLIDDTAIGVIVNWNNSMDLVARLEKEGPTYNMIKQLNQYTVSIYERDFNKLRKAGLVKEVLEGIYVLEGREQYDEKIGLLIDNHWLNEILIC